MAVRETSRDSYKKITKLGAQQQLVFDAIQALEPCSDRDISKHLGIQVNQINGRRGELVDYGFVVEHGRKYDKETKRNVLTWVTTDPMVNRQIQKAVGKPKHTEEKKSVKKFSLRLKDGKMFTISEAMKDEIEASIKTQRGTIEIGNHVFALTNIVMPINEQKIDESLEVVKKEETREVILVEHVGVWTESAVGIVNLRREKVPFRTQKIGVETGRIHYDMLTYWQDDYYETLRDMREKA